MGVNKPINDRIATLLSIIGVSPSALGTRLKVDARHIKNVAYNGCDPNYKLIHGLITVYNINSNWLIVGTGQMFTVKSKLNTPCTIPEEEQCKQRFHSMLETLIFIDLWLVTAREECRKQLNINIEQEFEVRKSIHAKGQLVIGINAIIVLNYKSKLTINNTLKIW